MVVPKKGQHYLWPSSQKNVIVASETEKRRVTDARRRQSKAGEGEGEAHMRPHPTHPGRQKEIIRLLPPRALLQSGCVCRPSRARARPSKRRARAWLGVSYDGRFCRCVSARVCASSSSSSVQKGGRGGEGLNAGKERAQPRAPPPFKPQLVDRRERRKRVKKKR